MQACVLRYIYIYIYIYIYCTCKECKNDPREKGSENRANEIVSNSANLSVWVMTVLTSVRKAWTQIPLYSTLSHICYMTGCKKSEGDTVQTFLAMIRKF